MRHSRLTQSYSYQPPTLEVTAAELNQRMPVSSCKCCTPMNIQAEVSAPEKLGKPVSPTRRITTIIHVPNLASDVRKLHRSNIRRNLTHRIQMAKQQGNFRLLRLLETELEELVLS